MRPCPLLILALLPVLPLAADPGLSPAELARCERRAAEVMIHRDAWGVAHVYGRTDADAVFGMLYAQAEDDFPRIEANYVAALGRAAETEGPAALARDLRARMFQDPDELPARLAASPLWLRELMTAFADGLNFYLHHHRAAAPRVLHRFEPWMALAFTEGSIGGDVETVGLGPLAEFHGVEGAPRPPPRLAEPRGSNGFAIAPARSATGRALLLINPHTTFHFRAEIHATSGEGLDAYGAATWGQFFVYQGFNDRAGWMHTTGGGDAIDEYALVVERADDGAPRYRHAGGTRPLAPRDITVLCRTAGGLVPRTFRTWSSHHGPVVRAEGGRWIAVRLLRQPVESLAQSFLRTKARSLAEFRRVLELRTNTSNNTVYADADGTIAYFHGNFVPQRDPRFDWTLPLDGGDPATDWRGAHPIEELIAVTNPTSGWVQNTNTWPFACAGPDSPKREDYPAYFWTPFQTTNGQENPRGRQAVRVLSGRPRFSLEDLIAAAYDPHLIAFEGLLPPLLGAVAALPESDPRRARLAEPAAILGAWDRRTGTASVPATLALLWAQDLADRSAAEIRARRVQPDIFLLQHVSDPERVAALDRTVARLERDFGTWRTPWGEVNRFQRISGDLRDRFDDAQPSLPVGFAPGVWGALAAYGTAGGGPGTRRLYGTRGNAFVAAVEFGPRVRAKSILAGGASGDPRSPHFADQAPLFVRGEFKDVVFHREDVERAARRSYRPGSR